MYFSGICSSDKHGVAAGHNALEAFRNADFRVVQVANPLSRVMLPGRMCALGEGHACDHMKPSMLNCATLIGGIVMIKFAVIVCGVVFTSRCHTHTLQPASSLTPL